MYLLPRFPYISYIIIQFSILHRHKFAHQWHTFIILKKTPKRSTQEQHSKTLLKYQSNIFNLLDLDTIWARFFKSHFSILNIKNNWYEYFQSFDKTWKSNVELQAWYVDVNCSTRLLLFFTYMLYKSKFQMKPTILLLIISTMNTLIQFVVHFVKEMVIPSFTSFVNVSLVVNTIINSNFSISIVLWLGQSFQMHK